MSAELTLMAPPARLYGSNVNSSYQRQGIALSKHFKPLLASDVRPL